MRNKRLYNYIVNTLGITRELVMEHVNSRIEDLLKKHLASKLDSNYFENLVVNRATQIIQDGVQSGYYRREAFNDFVKRAVREAVQQRVNEEFSLDVKIVPKDASIVRKA